MFKIKSMAAQTHDSSMDSIIYKREKEEETKDNQMNETKQELEAKIREQLRLKQGLKQDLQAVYVVLEKNEYQANLLRTRLMLEVTKAENNQALKAMMDNNVDLKAANWYNKQ